MNTKLFARIGAGVFVAIALTMTAFQLREERPTPPPETISVAEPEGDPLPAQIRACAAVGEQAVDLPDCRAAWAENRRRFLAPGARPMERFPQPAPEIDRSRRQLEPQPLVDPTGDQ